jgi:hypothetical protein
MSRNQKINYMTDEERDEHNKIFIKHSEYDNSQTNLICDMCQIEFTNDCGVVCKHNYACYNCVSDSCYDNGYCIMNGDLDFSCPENVPWPVIAFADQNIVLYGLRDILKYKKGYIPNYKNLNSYMDCISEMYTNGTYIGKSIIYDKDDMKIINSIEKIFGI